MKVLTRSTSNVTSSYPIKVIQFGEGNFLRAFADWMIDVLNEKGNFQSGVAVVQPIEQGMVDLLEKQQGLYHLLMRGLSHGEVRDEKRLISCIQQTVNPFADLDSFLALAQGKELSLILSNTTEAGIEFDADDKPQENGLAKTFPGKLTQLLWARYQYFKGDPTTGVGIIPCELIDRNGDKLKQAVLDYANLWSLDQGFSGWLNSSNYFGNTLVDRIVPGYPRDEIDQIREELGYDDQLVVSAELFHLWIIEGPPELQDLFPAHRYGLNVKFVDDQTPYRTRKVRILNGSHTSMVAVGMLANLVTVKEAVEHRYIGPFIRELIYEEIIPTIDLPREELRNFADEVIERFMNPFIRHELKSISLNSISKFKVRVLPTILDYLEQQNHAPMRLCTAFASLIQLYLRAAAGEITLKDDARHLEFFQTVYRISNPRQQVFAVLANRDLWGQDLTEKKILLETVTKIFEQLNTSSVDESILTLQQN